MRSHNKTKGGPYKIGGEDLRNLVLGQIIDLPPLMPELSDEPVKATVKKIEEGKYWEFDLSWHGVFFSEANAEVHNKELLWSEL